MKIDINTAKEAINQLIGCRIVRYKRICDMVCLYFTDNKSISEQKSKYDEPFGLHIMCWVRVLQENTMIAASEEMYCPSDPNAEDFKYDVDRSIFDARMNCFLTECYNSYVSAVNMQVNGDLTVFFDNKYRIEIMSHRTNTEDEMWRFIADADHPHLIASIDGYDYSDE